MSMESSERIAVWKRTPCSAEPQSVETFDWRM